MVNINDFGQNMSIDEMKQLEKCVRLFYSPPRHFSSPKKIENMVKRSFHSIVLTLHKSKASSCTDADLSGNWQKRRQNVILKYIPKVQELYADKYTNICIEEEFVKANILPQPYTYHTLDLSYGITLGAAIWILDWLRDNGKLHLAYKYLSQFAQDLDKVEMPDVSDISHSDNLLRAMVYVIEDRNGALLQPNKEEKRYLADEYAAIGKPPKEGLRCRAAFEDILQLIDDTAKETAARHFGEKLWQWMDQYLFGLNAIEGRRKHYTNELLRFFENHPLERDQLMVEPEQQKQLKVFSFDAALETTKKIPFLAEQSGFSLMSNPREKFTLLMNELEKIDNLSSLIRIMSFLGKSVSEKYATSQLGNELGHIVSDFSVDDPFEICFALLYLLDSGSDVPWIYTAGIAVVYAAAAKLPWGYERCKDTDTGLSDEAAGKDSLKEVLSGKDAGRIDWYALCYEDGTEESDVPTRKNLAQLVYQLTGVIIPRTQNNLCFEERKILETAAPNEQIDRIIDTVSLLKYYRRQIDNIGSENEQLFGEAAEEDNTAEETYTETDIASLQEQLAVLRKENKALKKSAHQAAAEAADERNRYARLEKTAEQDRKELTELREWFFNQENEVEERVDTSITYVTATTEDH